MKYTVIVKVELEAEGNLRRKDGWRMESAGVEAGKRLGNDLTLLGEVAGLEWTGCSVRIEEDEE